MIKRITIIFLLFLVYGNAFTQEKASFSCGTSDKRILENRVRTDLSNSRIASGEVSWLPIQIFRITHDDGSASEHASSFQLEESIAYSNRFFINSGIQVYTAGPEITVNNSANLQIDNQQEAQALYSEYNDPEIFEIFIVDGFTNNGAPISIAGRSYGPYIIINNQSIGVYAHELGHSLNLAHTFATDNGVELVSRDPGSSNCSVAGDGICDTEADPNGLPSEYTTGEPFEHLNCEMTSTTMDVNGDLYTPPFSNLMSYFSSRCGMEFTPGQYDIMTRMWNYYYEGNYNENLNTATIAGTPTNISSEYSNGQLLLSWSNAINGMAIQVEYSYDGQNFTVLEGLSASATEFVIPNFQSQSSYFVRLRHVNSAANTYSEVYEVTTGEQVYCMLTNPDGIADPNRTFGGGKVEIEKGMLSSTNESAAPYSFYSSDTARIMPGGNYALNMEGINYSGNSFWQLSWVVYLDSDLSGSFEKDEILYRTIPESDVEAWVNTEISVPEDASPGLSRIRVVTYNGYDYENLIACGITYNSFEVEDYPVTILDPTETPLNLVGEFSESDEGVKLTWEPDYHKDYYVIYKSEDLFNFSAIDTVFAEAVDGNFEYVDNNLQPGVVYEYKVAKMFATPGNSVTIEVPKGTPSYCTPTFTGLCAYDGFGVDEIEESTTGFAVSTSECKAYEDSRSSVLDVSSGQSYSLNLYFGGWAPAQFGVWADYNHNSAFETEELIAEGTADFSGAEVPFTVPEDALSGGTVLRVMTRISGTGPMSACGEGFDGQAEDITLNITGGRNHAPEKLKGEMLGNQLTLSWEVPETSSPVDSYVIESTMDGEVYSVFAQVNGTESSYSVDNFSSPDGTVFRVFSVTNGANSPYSNLIKIQTDVISGVYFADSKELKIYPNPTTGILTIDCPYDYELLKVTTISGKTIEGWSRKGNSVDLQKFNKGLYFVHILVNGQPVVQQISVL